MKTIGLIGGMSWESSACYYRLINEATKRRLGGHHSARSVMYTVDFAEVEEMQQAGDWDRAGHMLGNAARNLERGGADMIVLCTNTMHLVSDQIADAVEIPFLHIADATAEAIKARHVGAVGLLGTRFTMEKDFYRARLTDVHGLRVIVPEEPDRTTVHDVIYNELVHGRIERSSHAALTRVIDALIEGGAEGVVLGCTELGLLIGEDDVSVPLFDTTRIHAEHAVEMSLGPASRITP